MQTTHTTYFIAIALFLATVSGCKKTSPDTQQTDELSKYEVTTVAGSTAGFADGYGSSAKFSAVQGISVDAQGNIYVADEGNLRIRKITPAGEVSTLAGSGKLGYADGNRSTAEFSGIADVAADAQGNIYVAEGVRIRKVTPTGDVSTIAGSTSGYLDGPVNTAKFSRLTGIAVDAHGIVYVSEGYLSERIRKITPAGEVTTLAGTGTAGFADGNGSTAMFSNPTSVATDRQGNVYVSDYGNRRIRKITSTGVVNTFAVVGTSPGSGPEGVATDDMGNVYVAESGFFGANHRILKLNSSGEITIIFGDTQGYIDGNGSNSRFSVPSDVAVDLQGNIYVNDYNYGNSRIRKIMKK